MRCLRITNALKELKKKRMLDEKDSCAKIYFLMAVLHVVSR